MNSIQHSLRYARYNIELLMFQNVMFETQLMMKVFYLTCFMHFVILVQVEFLKIAYTASSLFAIEAFQSFVGSA